ncbi:4-hydroxy-tetrahydrodipicolinate synthase [Algicola sagamiensis]|uniref:4-hydroxy-tetrahydrodipicolinate synthase n=1 Tax=Algicola sagamiensis TaxID=163869 RepID=UPI000379283D|nr:4-hydroxy-tetrahydrodipicolinate synthase [Algicola sagamiensis]
MKLQGIYVPVITPFDHEEKINFRALSSLIELQINAGVSGIIASGTTGESYALSQKEQHDVMAHIANVVDQRVQLIAGVNDTCTAGSIEKAKQAKALGYQGLMLAPPAYCLPSQSEIIYHYQSVSEAVDLPIIMYNFPARTGVEISLETVHELSFDANIIGIKESSGDFSRAIALLSQSKDDFSVVCGSDDQAADYFYWGAKAWIAGAANFLPELHVEIYHAGIEERYVEMKKWMKQLLPIVQHMESENYNQKAKLGCQFRGVSTGNTRPPLQSISDHEKENYLSLLDRVFHPA